MIHAKNHTMTTFVNAAKFYSSMYIVMYINVPIKQSSSKKKLGQH